KLSVLSLPTVSVRFLRLQRDQRLGLDHGIGHVMLFEVDSEVRAPAPPMPILLRISSAASDRKSAPLPSSRQAGRGKSCEWWRSTRACAADRGLAVDGCVATSTRFAPPHWNSIAGTQRRVAWPRHGGGLGSRGSTHSRPHRVQTTGYEVARRVPEAARHR